MGAAAPSQLQTADLCSTSIPLASETPAANAKTLVKIILLLPVATPKITLTALEHALMISNPHCKC